MTAKPLPGKASRPGAFSGTFPGADRHVYGPRAIGAVLPSVTRSVYRKHGVGLGQLLADWTAIVGPALGATTTPRRLSAGTLTLGCAGPMALELQHLAGPLMERINTHLGRAVVQRLRFMQEAAVVRPPPPPKRPVVAPVVVAGLPDGPLRDALAALGAAIHTERA